MILKTNHSADALGTSLQGEIVTSYANLVKLFGKHRKGDYKTDAEWTIETPFGIATIYNYKDGKNYCGRKDGLAIRDITDWHIGAMDSKPAIAITIAVESFIRGIESK